MAGEGRLAPNEQVMVRTGQVDPALAGARSLAELMSIIGRRAQSRRLTNKKLQEILNEDR